MKKLFLIGFLMCMSLAAHAEVEFKIEIPMGMGKAFHWDDRKVQLESGKVKLKVKSIKSYVLDVGDLQLDNRARFHNQNNEFDIDLSGLNRYTKLNDKVEDTGR